MLKFVVLSVLVLGCTAAPYVSYGYGSGNQGYGTSLLGSFRYGSGGAYKSGATSYGTGYGLGYGNAGYGYSAGYGAGYRAVPAASYSYSAQPALSYSYAAQPALSYSYAAQPALSYSYAAQPANYAFRAGHSGALLSGVQAGQQQVSLLHNNVGEARQVVQAAVHQVGRTVEYRASPYQEQPIEAQVVEVEPSDNPLHLHFKSRSSTVSLSQSHEAAPAQETQVTSSQDEPSRLVHEVQKPVIQEVREVITPFRQVTQEVNPVQEAVHTVVTKAEGQRAQYAGNLAAHYSGSQSVVAAPAHSSVQYSAAAAPVVAVAAPAASSAQLSTARYQSAQYVAPAVSAVQYHAAPYVSGQYSTQYTSAPLVASAQYSAPVSSGASYRYSSSSLGQPLSSYSYSASPATFGFGVNSGRQVQSGFQVSKFSTATSAKEEKAY